MDWIDEHGSGQLGLVTMEQALKHVSPDQLHRLIKAGILIVVFRGVYRTAGTPQTWDMRVLAACLAGGDGVFAGFRTAGRLWRMRRVPSQRIEVVSEMQIRLPGVLAHESNLLLPEHVVRHPPTGIWVTTPPRTICDVSAVLGVATVSRICDAARMDGLVTYDEIGECREQLRARGRRRTTVIDEILERRLPGFGKDETDGELRIFRWIVEAGLPVPVQQHWVTVNGMRYCCDLAYPEKKVDIEYFGYGPHGVTREAFDHDHNRVLDFDAAGWDVTVFTDAHDRRTVVRAVRRKLGLD